MGDVRRVLITGATGFIGRATVAAAEASGLDVVALGSKDIDLSAPNAAAKLQDLLPSCQAVIHLAAAINGTPDAHDRVTVQGTRAVLNAMKAANVGHLVLVSSLAVYALEGLGEGEAVQSDTPLDTPATARDDYAAAKLKQEEIARAAGVQSLKVLRPGIVYDDARLWNAHLGVGAGPVFFRFPRQTVLPLCHVERLAKEILGAAKTSTSRAELICDPDLPTRGAWIERIRAQGWSKIVVPFPWIVLRITARLLSPISGKLPGLLRPRVLEQRLYPMGRITADDPVPSREGA